MNNRTTAFFLLGIGMVMAISVTRAHAELARTLRLGDRGADVRELQVFLNSDVDTRIAMTGVGAPGYESEYFGQKTLLAVNRFQAKYASEVLTPAGLLYPTGMLGPRTRAKIEQLRALASTPPLSAVLTPTIVSTPAAPIIPPSPLVAPRPPVVTSITPTKITKQNEIVTLTGTFAPYGNTVIISSEEEGGIGSFDSIDGKSISFPFNFSFANKLAQQLFPYKSSARYGEIVTTVLNNLQGPEVVRMNGTTYSRVILVVKNEYGQSAPQTLYIDLKALLTSY